MTTLVIGSDGVLGSAILARIPGAVGTSRRQATGKLRYELGWDPITLPDSSLVYLCAGTKGWRECEGNREVFRADVDGNIRLARYFLHEGAFVVFISTDGVEWGANLAYGRNRLLVEVALAGSKNAAIIRPGKFVSGNVGPLADLCVDIGNQNLGGIHYWVARE